MKHPIALLLVLLHASAWAATPTPGTQPIFSRSDPAPEALDPGKETLPWTDAADLQADSIDASVSRWTTQAEAGRARAAMFLARYWLERIPEDPQNCAKAIDWLLKADKLGANEAAGWLGHVYRRFDCTQRDLKQAAAWLRKAVPLLTLGAADDLHDILAATDSPEPDPAQAYTYARVGAPQAELTIGKAAAEAREAALVSRLNEGQRKSAGAAADKLLAAMDQRRLTLSAAPREEKLKPSASGKDWNVGLAAFDDLRECTANTAGNCRGVRRLAYFDAQNRSDEYQRCKLALEHREFATNTAATLERETMLPPKSTRRLIAGRIGEVAGNALRVTCTPVAGLAANVAAGKCKAKTTGVPSISDFYPPGSKQRGEEGRVLLYAWIDQKAGQPSMVELMGSSGFPELDRAGVKMGTYMAFSSECDYGWLPLAVGFRLQDAN